MTGAEVADVFRQFLAELRHTGYLPACEPHPITGALCTRTDCTGEHDPWTEPEENP